MLKQTPLGFIAEYTPKSSMSFRDRPLIPESDESVPVRCSSRTCVSGLAVSALLAFWMSESACLKCPICSYALARRTRALWYAGTVGVQLSRAEVHSFTASLNLHKEASSVDKRPAIWLPG